MAASRGAASAQPASIVDLASFRSITGPGHEVAAIYFYAQLDDIAELAYAISLDFFARPHLYVVTAKPSLGPAIAKLRARYGTDESLPDTKQRHATYDALFGDRSSNDGTRQGDFARLRDELIGASRAFAERTFDSGLEMLKDRVRKEHRLFKDYLLGLQGDSVSWSDGALANLTEATAYTILRSAGVSAVFGITSPPPTTWPYQRDPNGDKLVEEAAAKLGIPVAPMPRLTRERISNLQRSAVGGAEAIAAVIDFDAKSPAAALISMITKLYTWGSALNALAPAKQAA